MSGEADLTRLLAGMEPTLDPETYVFAVTDDPAHPASGAALMTMTESEGLTLILPERLATPDLKPVFVCHRITLTVHSSLAAVGLTAACAGALTRAGISCNTVAGYYHDHFFVPVDRADDAMAALWALAGH
jgi:uncharacterized protein